MRTSVSMNFAYIAKEKMCAFTQTETHARHAHPFTYTWSQFACGKTKECNNCTTLHTLRTYTLTSLTHCIQTMQMQIRLRLLLLLLDRWYLSKTTVSKCIHVRPFALISLLNIFQFIRLRWLRLIPFDLCDMTRTNEKPIYQAWIHWHTHSRFKRSHTFRTYTRNKSGNSCILTKQNKNIISYRIVLISMTWLCAYVRRVHVCVRYWARTCMHLIWCAITSIADTHSIKVRVCVCVIKFGQTFLSFILRSTSCVLFINMAFDGWSVQCTLFTYIPLLVHCEAYLAAAKVTQLIDGVILEIG